MTVNINWYALYTRPRYEKKIAAALVQKQMQAYCPLYRVMRVWSDRKKWIQEPLFRSYVFVKVSEKDLWRTTQVNGVVKVLNREGKPAIIKDAELEMVEHFLKKYAVVNIERTEIKINDQVRILHGPFLDCKGSVVRVKNNRIKVLLPSLGYIMTAEVCSDEVELLNGKNDFNIK